MTQKIFKTRRDHVNSIGSNIADLMLPNRNYADSALIAQRGTAARHNAAQAAIQELKKQEMDYALGNAGDLGILERLGITNPSDMLTAAKAQTELASRPDILEQLGQKTLAGNMMLNVGGRPPGPREIALNVADEMEADERQLPEEVPWSMNDKLGAFAFLSNKAPGAGATFTEEDQLNLRASQPTHTATDLARALMIEKTTPGKVNLLEKQAGVQEAEIGVKAPEQKQIETMTPLQAALLRGKTSVQLANVEKIIQGMALDEAESMQTQQKLINEGNLAEARKNKVNV